MARNCSVISVRNSTGLTQFVKWIPVSYPSICWNRGRCAAAALLLVAACRAAPRCWLLMLCHTRTRPVPLLRSPRAAAARRARPRHRCRMRPRRCCMPRASPRRLRSLAPPHPVPSAPATPLLANCKLLAACTSSSFLPLFLFFYACSFAMDPLH